MYHLYQVLIALAIPLALLVLLRGGARGSVHGGRWRERLGDAPEIADGLEVWVHAASVGEVQAASPLVDALIGRYGEGRVGVTTMTATGSALVRQRWGARVIHAYVPFDLPPLVRRRLAVWRPRAVVILESELWPVLIRELARRSIPVLIANARMSPRSQRRYARLGGLVRGSVGRITAIAAQSADDAAAYRALGARQVEVTGNLKFDCAVPTAQQQAGEQLRRWLSVSRPVWVAASTHEGEESAALAAHRALLDAGVDAALILVPRHPQRFDGVARQIAHAGFEFARRSDASPAAGRPPPAVLLGDSMGEMFCYLAAADVAFVGGSLVPVGGHNVLEPAALARPVLFGPAMHNQRPARALLLEAGGGIEVADAADLAAAVARLLGNPDEARRIGASAQACLQAHAGATQRVLAVFDTLTPR
ncbi:lipid IV(A) 3-deoxy-D-manno-octulosonic acid transferase [Sinimarinibacterium flocculans]|uniref:lipid IV(A) 3-deoxy-D-manno-octulosonic acid transferase n=1 Tax=Sinimarinibacterium flocculans TaxID=985250 RepID=UPI00249064BD|nr:lipid IV(A) 3-deoxy-D-manno-octulosonic acid transferase [Sinimarinibacterium flocculans]